MPTFLAVLFLIVCVLLILVVLLQKGRGGGLGAAFGGGAGSAFGTRTGDVFTWVTIVLTGLFLVLAIAATLAFRPPGGTVAMPTFEPMGPIQGRTGVTIRAHTTGAKIRYTTDGTDPTDRSALYTEYPVQVEVGMTLKAQCVRAGMDSSEILSYTYNLPVVKAPTFTPDEGPLDEPTDAMVSCETAGAAIHYTLDGQEPTTDSPKVDSGKMVSVRPDQTLKARAFADGMTSSEITSVTYHARPAPAETRPAETRPGDGE